MHLPVNPPVAPMLAKPVGAIPSGDYVFEPKWDGFRSIVFRDGDEVEIGSRNERPMTRYFPELVDAIVAELPPRCVIDGGIVLPDFAAGRLDFEALQLRIHPAASRVELLATQTPGHFMAFDLLALGDTDYMERPFAERRTALEGALAGAGLFVLIAAIRGLPPKAKSQGPSALERAIKDMFSIRGAIGERAVQIPTRPPMSPTWRSSARQRTASRPSPASTRWPPRAPSRPWC